MVIEAVGLLIAIGAISGIVYLLYKSLQWVTEDRKDQRLIREKEEEERQKWEKEEADRERYFREQLALARTLKRTDEEIKQWAERNYNSIIEREAQIIAGVQEKLKQNWREWFLQRFGGRELIAWYEEPLLELKFAKQFYAEKRDRKARLEEVLAEELLQAKVLEFRREIEQRLEKIEEGVSDEFKEPKILARDEQGLSQKEERTDEAGFLRRLRSFFRRS